MALHRTHAAPLSTLLAALLLGTATAPALADNGNVPPGDPCGDGPGQGTGNPCNGNNGNIGAQGNAGNGQAPFEPIELPAFENRGVFVTQIGETNRAEVDQQSGSSYARVVQDGAENRVKLAQGAGGTHYASIGQDGESNVLDAAQDGSGQTVLLLAQQGNLNEALVRQTDNGAVYSAAAVRQDGEGNRLMLVQNGSDNQARLTQEGDNNEMTATQLGDGNRLEWSQLGSGLPNLQVVQQGSGTLQVTQSNTGAQFAPPPAAGG